MLHRIGVLVVTVVISPVVAQVHNMSALPDARAELPRHRHGPIRNLQTRPDGSSTSENWSGWVVTGGSPGSVRVMGGSH